MMARILKWPVRIIGFAIIIFVIIGVVSFFLRPGEAPSSIKAAYAVQTYSNDELRIPSRIYLCNEVSYLDDGTPVISDYYTYDGKGWHKQRGSKEFPISLYGISDITKRGTTP